MIDSKGLRLLIGDQVVQIDENLDICTISLDADSLLAANTFPVREDFEDFQWFWREWAPRTGYVLDVGNLRTEYEQYEDIRARLRAATHAAEMARKEVEIVALNTETQMYRQKLESGAYMGILPPQNPPTSDFGESKQVVLPWKGKQ